MVALEFLGPMLWYVAVKPPRAQIPWCGAAALGTVAGSNLRTDCDYATRPCSVLDAALAGRDLEQDAATEMVYVAVYPTRFSA